MTDPLDPQSDSSRAASQILEVVDEDVLTTLLTASRVLIAISARSLSKVEDSLTLSEFRALVVMQTRGPCTPHRLAELLDLGRRATGRLIERLHDEEIVHLTADGAYALTRRGSSLVATVTDTRRELLADIVSRMQPVERSQLVDSLLAFSQAAGEPLATGTPRTPHRSS